jgi:hypothetical protein
MSGHPSAKPKKSGFHTCPVGLALAANGNGFLAAGENTLQRRVGEVRWRGPQAARIISTWAVSRE